MTGESRSMEQNVLERSGLMKDFLSEKINGLKRERLKEIREKLEDLGDRVDELLRKIN